jgi:hypothetical protein
VKHLDCQTMCGVEIHDMHPRGYLSFDLKDILRSLHDEVVQRVWKVDSVESTGDATRRLEYLSESGDTISGLELIDLAEHTNQVIWGTFRGDELGASSSKLTIKAIDSTLWEVFGDTASLRKLQASFQDVRPARYTEED